MSLFATVLGFAVMIQCAAGTFYELLGSPARVNGAAGFALAGFTPAGAALASWQLGAQEPERRMRILKTAVVTLIVETLLLVWFATHGVLFLNSHWL